MSGAVNTVGKFFNSTPGRVLTGIATGGASEIGRAASGIARRSGVDPGISAAIGYAAGSRESGASTAGALGANNPAPVGPAKSGGVAAASSSITKTNEDAQRELDQSLAAPPDVPEQRDPINPYEEEEASRRRARESSLRASGGKRRASQQLTYLGA